MDGLTDSHIASKTLRPIDPCGLFDMMWTINRTVTIPWMVPIPRTVDIPMMIPISEMVKERELERERIFIQNSDIVNNNSRLTLFKVCWRKLK